MRRPRMTEAGLDSVYNDVRAYAQVAGYYDKIEDLEIRISQGFSTASESEMTFEAASAILRGRLADGEGVQRRAAWYAQRVLGGRSCCVGNHVLQERDGKLMSPLVEQLKQYGLAVRDVDFTNIRDAVAPVRPKKRIEGLIIDQPCNKLTLIKGLGIERRRLLQEPTLFDRNPRHAVVRRATTSAIGTLVMGEWILRSALPTVDVRCILMLVDPDLHSRDFMAIETTGTFVKQLSGEWHSLEPNSVVGSSDLWRQAGHDLEDLALPSTLVAREGLMRLPVDRATRCLMVLDVLWSRQAGASGLAAMTVGEIAREVERRFLIEYTNDHRRHDIEDCLENGGFVERPPYESKCYALTATGVYQGLVTRRLLSKGLAKAFDGDLEANVLGPIRKQARLWARYHGGDQVVE